MGVYIIFIILLISAIVLSVVDYDFTTRYFLYTLSLVVLFAILVPASIAVRAYDCAECSNYEELNTYVNNIQNSELSPEERNVLITKVLETNKLIRICSTMKHNFWIGMFYYHKLGDMPLIDTRKIPSANINVILDNQ